MFLKSASLLAGVVCGFLVVDTWAQSSLAAQQSAATSGLSQINHIIILAQENRSFDQYFGELRQYWVQNGYSDQSFDGLPQFNPTSGAPPLQGPAPSIPGCDPAFPPPNDCKIDSNSPHVTSFELLTRCAENTSPSWNEAHRDWDLSDPTGLHPAKMNGFVRTAGHNARNIQPNYYDTDGKRAMGYYTEKDLNYYYFIASNFATSDRWFQPAMTRTQPNREYLYAATSQGYVYPQGTNSANSKRLTATTILQELQSAGMSWKIYVNPSHSPCTGPPYSPSCLLTRSYIKYFAWGQTIPTNWPSKIAPISQYFTDVNNGTLPQVSFIEPASDASLDEHPSVYDQFPVNIQAGARYVSTLINALMCPTVLNGVCVPSPSWHDSAFILTYDESGGLYDHVSPQSMVNSPPRVVLNPDGIAPKDLLPGDYCNPPTGKITTGTCDFVYTGYRVPLIVVSPFTKKHFVSHTSADTTAILKLIETRFKLPSLTKRDAEQMDMTEFFDFSNPPWSIPAKPPAQFTNGLCYVNTLP